MHDVYDVIIIGTGAGGGTLALDLAPSGRASSSGTGRMAQARAAKLERREVFVENRYVSKGLGATTMAKRFDLALTIIVGGATKMYGAALFRLREQRLRRLRHHDGLSPAWPISYRRWSRTTRARRTSTRCTARAAKTQRSRRQRAVSAPGRFS